MKSPCCHLSWADLLPWDVSSTAPIPSLVQDFFLFRSENAFILPPPKQHGYFKAVYLIFQRGRFYIWADCICSEGGTGLLEIGDQTSVHTQIFTNLPQRAYGREVPAVPRTATRVPKYEKFCWDDPEMIFHLYICCPVCWASQAPWSQAYRCPSPIKREWQNSFTHSLSMSHRSSGTSKRIKRWPWGTPNSLCLHDT